MDSIFQVTVFATVGQVGPTDEAVVSTSIAELDTSASIGRNLGYLIHSKDFIVELGPRDLEDQAILAQDRDDILEPVVQVTGAKFVCIPKDEETSKGNDRNSKLCWDVLWEQNPDSLSQDDVAKR